MTSPGPAKRAVLWRLAQFGAPHRGLLARAFACMALLGATTGAYAFLMGPALKFLLSGGDEGLELAGRLWPGLARLDRAQALWAFPAVLVGIGVLKAFAYLGQFYWTGLFGQKVASDLRRALFLRLTSLSPTQHSRQLTGDLLSRLSADVSAVETAATYAVGAYARDGLQLVVLVAVALALSWKLTLVVLLAAPVAVIPVVRLTRAFLRRTREGQGKLGAIAAQVQEGLGGLRTVQAFTAEAAELERFDGHSREHQRALIRAGWIRGAVPSLMEALAAGALALALVLALRAGATRPESLVSFLTALVLAYQPIKELGRVSQLFVQAQVAGERLFEMLDLQEAIPDPGARAIGPVRQSIRLEDVAFSWGDRVALAGVDLEIPVGKVTALVGPSGSGKSTLTALLLRFEAPSRGRIEIDGLDVGHARVESVRAQFALVTQEPLLFSGSVLENLRWVRSGASMDEVVAAARVAQADGFIRALPQGYDTRIGERGVVLSGGQKQRLCLARALVAQAPVLVLDEATSNLDPENEREVQDALACVLPGRTALVIAHRLSTVTRADRIFVIDQGRIVEAGTHEALLQRGGLYARMWRLQQEPLARAQVG